MKAFVAVLAILICATAALALPWLDEWEVGDKGMCGYLPKVLQIISDDKVLLGNDRQGPLVMFRCDARRLVVGKTINFGDNVIEVTGTFTYKTAFGTRTVLDAKFADR